VFFAAKSSDSDRRMTGDVMEMFNGPVNYCTIYVAVFFLRIKTLQVAADGFLKTSCHF